LYCVSLSTHV
jgi:hypothetical protein